MRLRYTPKYLFGATTLLAFGASIAFAQDTTRTRPRSQQRIPISKDAPTTTRGRGPARVDTVTVFKTDTLRVTTQLPGRVDTVRTTNTVTVHDTVRLAPPPRVLTYPNGLYFGVGGGVMAPNGAIFNPNSSGPSAQAQIGWQGDKRLLGVRFDANWAKPGEDAFYAGYQGDPDIVNFSGDLKLALPWFRHWFGLAPVFTIYGIGGGTYVIYKNLPIRLNPGEPGGIAPINVRVGDTDWLSKFGWNAGGGMSMGWRRTEVFFETRVIGFKEDITPMARQMPFVLGVNFFGGAR